MTAETNDLTQLVEDLGFTPVESNKALGEPAGIPATLVVLNVEPLSLLFRFRVNPAGKGVEPIHEFLKSVPNDCAEFSLDDGFAFLTMRRLDGLPGTSIRVLVDHIAALLAQSDLVVAPGCQLCGDGNASSLLLIQGLPVRLCQKCLSSAVQEQHEIEEEINRPTLAATLGLPAIVLFVALGWLALWTAIDFVLDKFEVEAIVFSKGTTLLYLGLVACVGFVLGMPLGSALRKSVFVNRAPKLMSALVVAGAALGGEIGYIAVRVFRLAGVFEIGLGARLLWNVVSNYSGFWIACKLAFLLAIWGCSVIAATTRRQVGLNVRTD